MTSFRKKSGSQHDPIVLGTHNKVSFDPLGEHFTVLIDSNEGKRIHFPEVMRWQPRGCRNSQVVTIASRVVNLGRLSHSRGDYSLDGYTHVTAVEKKGGIAELAHNIKTGKLEQQLYNLRRLVRYPYLLLDFPLPKMYGTGGNAIFRENDPTPCALDRVFAVADKYQVPVLGPTTAETYTTRIMLGEYLIRRMLSHIKGETYVPYEDIQAATK